MENSECLGPSKQDSPPSLIRYIGSNDVVGFDSIEGYSPLGNQMHATFLRSPKTDGTAKNAGPSQTEKLQHIHPPRTHSISISMPSSPLACHIDNSRRANITGHGETPSPSNASTLAHNTFQPKQPVFRSQPMPISVATRPQPKNPALDRLRDNRYDPFKTWSGKLERQLSNLRGIPCPETECEGSNTEKQHLPVGRYFDALEGPELDTLKDSEELVLPKDKLWPFLLRYPITSFGICLGISSQAMMWKILAISDSTQFLSVSLTVNLILWCISVALVSVVISIYACKAVFYFEAVRREYHHPIRVNFFFAPFIVFLFLAIGAPPSIAKNFHEFLWYVLMTPILCLEIKIYGQWMSGGKRRLSKVANPSNHLSIVGNFVGAVFGASMGLKEGPILFFAIGLAHYVVLFVTLYQRLPTNETLPKELHPVFFLFVAAPSIASVAWAKIAGSFDYGSRIAFFIALFLYFSLAVRVNLFRGFRFSLAWWAYTFPMAAAGIATINYANEVTNIVTQTLAATLCAIASLTSLTLLVTTILHAFVLRDLFPNDVGIAISIRKPKTSKKWFSLRRGNSDTKDLEASNETTLSCPSGITAP